LTFGKPFLERKRKPGPLSWEEKERGKKMGTGWEKKRRGIHRPQIGPKASFFLEEGKKSQLFVGKG